MKLSTYLLLAAVVLATSATGPRLAAQQRDASGAWLGSLKLGAMELRLVFNLTHKDDGTYSATLDSPDQGAKGIPVATAVVTSDSLVLGLPALRGRYAGVFSSDSTVDGNWVQAGQTFPLALRHSSAPVEIKRPQTPRPPLPYFSEDVEFRNTVEDFTLAGTLTMPKGQGPFPAVVLITGSGPQDRDETIFAHKPFLVLADHLTRKGFAVLRYDDRGVGQSKGSSAAATSDQFADDAEAALEYLRTRPELDHSRLGLAGHSEGGLIAPIVAARSKHVAFIVLLAGPGLPGDVILLRQGELIRRASGVPEDQIADQETLAKALYAVLRAEPDTAAAYKKMMAVVEEMYEKLPEEKKKNPEMSPSAIAASLRTINSAWFRRFLTYDPRPMLQRVSVPVLALNGELDLQVPARENIAAIEAALAAGGNTRVTTRILPKLNHLFQTAETGLMNEYGKIEETFAPSALEEISTWLLKVTAR
ncbi:MAG: alpha/beta hydrolase [Ignavibacteriae bacterium]|nr:alpha/beta hydrolase [Ignavibacteriota bacterium]